MDKCLDCRSAGRRAAGFTLVELLVVLALIGILIALLNESVRERQKQNQQAIFTEVGAIASAQQQFRDQDLDGDGADDYGSLAELGDAGLIGMEVADGMHAGYGLALATQPPPDPAYDLTVVPESPYTGVLRFYVDQTRIIRRAEEGMPGADDDPVEAGEECDRPLTLEQVQANVQLKVAAIRAIGRSITLSMGVDENAALNDAAGLVNDNPDLLPLSAAALDTNGDDAAEIEELLQADLLTIAGLLADEIGMGSGEAVGNDDELDVVLMDFQDRLSEHLQLELDNASGRVPLADIDLDPVPVWRLILSTAFQNVIYRDSFESQ